MNGISLRLRVAMAVAVTCIAVVTALSLAIYTASEDLEETLVDQIVSEEMDFLIRHHRENPAINRESGPNLQYYVMPPGADHGLVPGTLRALAPGTHEIGAGLSEQHIAVREVDGTRFIVAYDSGPHEMQEQKFKQLLLFALVTVIAIASAAGYWISGLVTGQLTGLASRVATPEPDTVHAPFARSDQDPEVSALARALDQYRARMQEMIRREREFTGNASHELRTPLTAILTSCELLAMEPGLSGRARARIADIATAARRMTGQLELLLALARAQVAGEADMVPIAKCVREALESVRPEAERKGLDLEIAVPENAGLALNRMALDMVVTNLLRNAVLYTQSGKVRICLEGRRLTVKDSGIGIPAAELPHIFNRRFYRGGTTHDNEGSGLGLAIIKRICDAQGWQIAAESTPACGSSFHVTFPEHCFS